MENKDRITLPDIETLTLRNGKVCKIRPLTFKEKKEYLVLVSKNSPSEEPKKTPEQSDVIDVYMNLQLEIAFFLLKILNEDITKEDVEAGVSGDLLKKMLDIAFYDPFGFINIAKL